jgi:ATP-dependent Clp protease ATP-binding subunit ClpX
MQVTIPKKEIDDLIETYKCSQDDAARAYLTAQDRSKEAFTETLDELLGPREHTPPERSLKCYTPRQIKEHLDKFIIGQEEYKKRICIAASYHFAMIQYLHENPDSSQVKRFRKKNTIIAGPSGSGKTYCAEVLGDLLEVPTLIVDATDYTEAGYVGKSADDMIRELIDLAPGAHREEQAQFVAQHGGIIFIDEMDKKAKEGGMIGPDISREGFQRSVLKLLERKQVSIDNPYSPASQIQEAMERQQGHKGEKKEKMISTGNILFILGGSFERNIDNLESIVKKRTENKGNVREDGSLVIRGFDFDQKAASPEKDKEKFKNYFKEANADDYVRFGLLPELVGRTPIRTFVNLLSKNDLVRIMQETADSILDQYELEFQLFDIEVEITDDAVEYVAEVAENKKTGARALVSVWENILTDFQYELPGSNFRKLIVSRELCERPRDLLLKMLEKSPFVDYIEHFKREYGIELVLPEEVQEYIETVAKNENLEVSATIKKLLSGASALNFMNYKEPFMVTKAMLEDPKYFDRMFTTWHEKLMTQTTP